MRSNGGSSLTNFATMVRTVADAVCETGPEFRCPYLPEKKARFSGIDCDNRLPSGLYEALMEANFRRNGSVVYRPTCDSCNACRMARIDVSRFVPNRSQRRCAARNTDLKISVAPSRATREKHRLYARYLSARHPPPPVQSTAALDDELMSVDAMDGSWDEFTSFLCSSCVHSIDIEFRLPSGRLVAVSVVDVEPRSLSAVYCYFDPSETQRSLGTFNILTLVQEARRHNLDKVYLGYWIDGSRKMNYKKNFSGVEIWSSASQDF